MHKPQLIPDEPITSETEMRIAYIQELDRAIFADPLSYQKAMRTLRKHVMSGTVELSPETGHDLQEGNTAQPYQLLLHFFGNRFDKASSFDETTEEKIQQRPQMEALLKNHYGHTSRARNASTTKTEYTPNESAVSIRDQIRMLRLGTYIGIVATYVRQTNSDNSVA